MVVDMLNAREGDIDWFAYTDGEIEATIMDLEEDWLDDDEVDLIPREVDEDSIARMVRILRPLAENVNEVAGCLWFHFIEDDGTEWKMSLDRWSVNP